MKLNAIHGVILMVAITVIIATAVVYFAKEQTEHTESLIITKIEIKNDIIYIYHDDGTHVLQNCSKTEDTNLSRTGRCKLVYISTVATKYDCLVRIMWIEET